MTSSKHGGKSVPHFLDSIRNLSVEQNDSQNGTVDEATFLPASAPIDLELGPNNLSRGLAELASDIRLRFDRVVRALRKRLHCPYTSYL
jgi:hypothetical protein